jgi:hypothetical protein
MRIGGTFPPKPLSLLASYGVASRLYMIQEESNKKTLT